MGHNYRITFKCFGVKLNVLFFTDKKVLAEKIRAALSKYLQLSLDLETIL